MELAFLPLLSVQRELYRAPRGMERFRAYLAAMTGGTGDVVLPLVAMNPMAKEHVPALLDAYLALDAEGAAAAATREAEARLRAAEGRLRVALVVCDDAGGGWTDRAQTDARHRFERRAEVKRGFATALLWSSEPPRVDVVRPRVLASVYRSAHALAFGDPRTLDEHLVAEGRALRFAGQAPGAVDPRARAVLDAHRGSARYPTLFACLWGDDEAERSGYPPLSVPAGAAFALAVAECRDDPVAALAPT